MYVYTTTGSIQGRFTYIFHKNQPNVGRYTIQGSSWIPWDRCPGVMNAYAGNADEFNCVRLFQEMCQRELKPTMTTYSIMMKCLGGGAELWFGISNEMT